MNALRHPHSSRPRSDLQHLLPAALRSQSRGVAWRGVCVRAFRISKMRLVTCVMTCVMNCVVT